jgi:thiamine kinase-like enzyme
MSTSLEQIIARMPQWAHASIQTTVLRGGITNQNYRVDVNGESFVVRVTGQDTELLGINRQHEYECSVSAAETGVAPEVIAFFPDLGSIITRFIHGKKILAADIGTRENIRRAAHSIRRLHQARRQFPGRFSAFLTVEYYHRIAQQLGCPMPADMNEILKQAERIGEAVYRGAPPPYVPCHNDLLNENFIDDGEIRIIDYEYSAMGNAFFDLANFSSHHKFDDARDTWLIESYFGAMDDTSFARLKLMKMASDLREAMWGVVQIKLSKLDFDYQAYANEFFGRYQAKWESANQRWLMANG